MKIRIPHLVQRAAANGGTRYYWQPSATLKAAGWQPQVLGRDLDAAMRAAAQWNERVEEWRAGAAAPTATGRRRQVQKYARRETLRELIADYRADRFEHLGAQTCRTYQSALNILDAWAGDQPVAHVTADRCKVLLKALATPAARGAPERLHRAAGVGRVLRTLMQWAEDAGRVEKNPMARVTIREPKARHHVWPDHCIEQFGAMADAMGLPAIGTATMLAADTGQREADLLKLTWGKLSMVGGRRSIRLRQAKFFWRPMGKTFLRPNCYAARLRPWVKAPVCCLFRLLGWSSVRLCWASARWRSVCAVRCKLTLKKTGAYLAGGRPLRWTNV